MTVCIDIKKIVYELALYFFYETLQIYLLYTKWPAYELFFERLDCKSVMGDEQICWNLKQTNLKQNQQPPMQNKRSLTHNQQSITVLALNDAQVSLRHQYRTIRCTE